MKVISSISREKTGKIDLSDKTATRTKLLCDENFHQNHFRILQKKQDFDTMLLSLEALRFFYFLPLVSEIL